METSVGSEAADLPSKPEMKDRVREFDWASTPLGPADAWPGSLKTSVDICLNSRFPMVIWWGRELIIIHNDAWRPIIGTKQVRALGQPGHTMFPEIWDILGPMHYSVLDTGVATWSDDQLLLMHRSKYVDLEEAYFTWSYSAILDESGKVGGVFTAVTETTHQILSERRLETLRKLSARAAEARTVVEACRRGAEALEENPSDIPFALLYLLEPGRSSARLVETVRVDRGTGMAPERIELEASESCQWCVLDVFRNGSAEHVTDLPTRFGKLPGGRWPDSPKEALVLPLTFAGQAKAGGVAVIGISPYLRLDENYRSFLDLAVGHLSTGISNANAYEQERKRAEALAELDRAKTIFFSNVSHEFRTPLTLMLGPLEDLLQTDQQTVPAPRERLDIIHRNGLRLLKLVNNLLDFSRIEAGRSQAVYAPTDIAVLTAELASVFRSAVEKAGLELIVDCRPLPEPVFVDREMWEKIVLNLLSNAFKFTLEGRITVRLRSNEGNVELSVEDTGSGIPEDQIEHVFERFHRVVGAHARSHEGTGIGLALVQELAKLHGGSVRVASTVGRGTTFTVSIPMGRQHLPADQIGAARSVSSTALRADAYVEEALRWLPEELQYAPATMSSDAERQNQPVEGRVILADDNADMRDYVRRLLAERYEVLAVGNGAEVLETLNTNPLPDLILTDVMMPVMDGFELIRRLREDERTRTVPVIMLSARAGEEARVEGLRSGADDYVVKPFTARELLARVHSQIALAKLRRTAELTVRAAEEHLRLAVNAAELGTWELNPDTGELKWGEHCRAMFAVPHDAEVNFDVFISRVHPDDRERMRLAWEDACRPDADRAYQWEYRVQWPDGTVRWLVAHGKSLLRLGADGAKPSVRMVGTVRDVTEIKRAEESMRETQKLESLGLLAGGIAHDFNNLLTGVIGNASLLAEDLPADSQQAETLQEIVRGAERIARLTSQMLAYSGRGRFSIESMDLSKQVSQIASLVQASVPKNVQLRLSLANDLPLINADTSQLQQVIMNLVINGAEAVGAGSGEVEVTTCIQRVGKEEIQANMTRETLPEGEYVTLTVRDTGCGMDESTRARIFDPFFTTKFTGRGLGLSAVLGIVRRHRGLLTVESRPGAGTTFRVYFPRSERQRFGTEAASGVVTRGHGTVLVVDDEEAVRTVAKAALSRLGYKVIMANNGDEAVRIFASMPDKIDVVLLDMMMPVMGGEEALSRLIELRPDVVVVAASGFDESEAEARFGHRIAGFVQKPFTIGQLGAKIGAALHAPRNA